MVRSSSFGMSRSGPLRPFWNVTVWSAQAVLGCHGLVRSSGFEMSRSGPLKGFWMSRSGPLKWFWDVTVRFASYINSEVNPNPSSTSVSMQGRPRAQELVDDMSLPQLFAGFYRDNSGLIYIFRFIHTNI